MLPARAVQPLQQLWLRLCAELQFLAKRGDQVLLLRLRQLLEALTQTLFAPTQPFIGPSRAVLA